MQKNSSFLHFFSIGLFTTLLIFLISVSFYFVEQSTKQNGFFTSSDIIVYRKYNDIIQVGFMGYETKIDTLDTKTKLDEFSDRMDIVTPPGIRLIQFSSDCFDYLSYLFLSKTQDYLQAHSLSD